MVYSVSLSISPPSLVPIEENREEKASSQPTCKTKQIGEELLQTRPEQPPAKRRKIDQPAPPVEIRIGEVARAFTQDFWVEYEGANLLISLLEQEITIESPDQLSKAICERAEELIAAFEKQAHVTVKKEVQERIKMEIENLSAVDPLVIGKLNGQIETVHDAFSLSSNPKGFEKADQLIRGGYIYFLKDAATQGFDVRPYVKRILELHPNFHKQLLELLGAIFAPYSSDFFITSLFNEFSCFLRKDTESGPTEDILRFAQELVDIKKKRNQARDLVFEECKKIVPFFQKSPVPKANLSCLKQVIAETSHLPFLQNEGTLWSPLLSRLSYVCTCGIPISSQLIQLYAILLHELQIGLKQKFGLSKKEERELFDGLAALHLDPKKGLQILESVAKQDKERLKSLLQEDGRAVIEFLTQGGTPILYTELKRHGVLKNQFSFTHIHWTKETVASLNSFSRGAWEKLKYLLCKGGDTPFHKLVSQIKC